MTGEVSKERPASRYSTGTNGLSESCSSERNYTVESPKLLERIIVRIEVTDTGYGIQQKEMYQTNLFSKRSITFVSCAVMLMSAVPRCLQSDRGR